MLSALKKKLEDKKQDKKDHKEAEKEFKKVANLNITGIRPIVHIEEDSSQDKDD